MTNEPEDQNEDQTLNEFEGPEVDSPFSLTIAMDFIGKLLTDHGHGTEELGLNQRLDVEGVLGYNNEFIDLKVIIKQETLH